MLVGVVALERPAHRGADVVEVRPESSDPQHVVRTGETVADFGGRRRVVRGVGTAPPVGVGGFVESFTAELPERLEHRVTGRAVGTGLGEEHRLRHQRRQRLGDLPTVELVGAGDCDRGGCVERADEDAEAVEHDPFVVAQELVRPLDRRPQSLLAFDAAAAPTGEEPEPLVEVRGDVGRAHRRRARRRELDGQRDPVHPPADLADGGPLLVVPGRLRACVGSAIGEQPHRRALDQVAPVGGRRGRRQRPHSHDALAGHVERLAARRDHAHVGARPHHRVGERTGVVQ